VSERGLVVHQQAMTDIEDTLRQATDDVRSFLHDLLDAVDQQITGWTEETPSRQAQRRYEHQLLDGADELAKALESVAAAVASHREKARDTEVENVAVVG
jgi:uncharacterized protein YukE